MKIDVHAHFLPAGYRAELVQTGHGHPDGMPWLPEWSADEHIAVMDRLGIARSLLSISSPGVCLGEQTDLVALAREVNEDGRRAVVDHPDRFGLLASLPLPDTEAALSEIAHCCEHFDADGFVVLTNTAGTYVSDPSFEPVFREISRRGVPVLLHPASPACWEHTSFSRPRPMLEFLFDTTRTVVDLVLNGVLTRNPELRLIVPHAGATLPLVAERVCTFARILAPEVDVPSELGRLHYDLAGHTTRPALDALLAITSIDHLHYGSDYCFTPEPVAAAAAAALDDQLVVQLRTNTEQLFASRF